MQNKIVTLALQGGGSHGAFYLRWYLTVCWKTGGMAFEGISGASAGAMNAAGAVARLQRRRPRSAREALAAFRGVSRSRNRSASRLLEMMPGGTQPADPDHAGGDARVSGNDAFLFADAVEIRSISIARATSSGRAGRLRAPRHPQQHQELFIAATKVSTGTLEDFPRPRTDAGFLAGVGLSAVHASRPVEIDGEAYWDGGLTANPPIFPLLHLCSSRDLMVVLLHPCSRPGTPTSTHEIGQRLSEISSSSAFFTELGGLALAKREAESGMFTFGTLERYA